MHRPGATDVAAAIDAMRDALESHTARDWQAKAGALDWSCWEVAAHVAHDLVAYAAQLTGHGLDRYLPMDLHVRPEAPPEVVLSIVGAAGTLLAAVVDAATQDTRGWHWGASDASGFAAMGIGEVLVHTFDVTAGLGVRWRPPGALAEAVVDRLLPGAPAGDPADVLLWATGRSSLADRAPAEAWVWKAAR